jgi:hypothetical protein
MTLEVNDYGLVAYEADQTMPPSDLVHFSGWFCSKAFGNAAFEEARRKYPRATVHLCRVILGTPPFLRNNHSDC